MVLRARSSRLLEILQFPVYVTVQDAGDESLVGEAFPNRFEAGNDGLQERTFTGPAIRNYENTVGHPYEQDLLAGALFLIRVVRYVEDIAVLDVKNDVLETDTPFLLEITATSRFRRQSWRTLDPANRVNWGKKSHLGVPAGFALRLKSRAQIAKSPFGGSRR